MNVMKESFYNILFTIEMSTGMRVGEIIALKWSNIDLNNSLIRVKESSRLVQEYDDESNRTDKVITKEPKLV
jgi:integrase